MKTTLSEKNPYYLNKERIYELRWFCRQYQNWAEEAANILYSQVMSASLFPHFSKMPSPGDDSPTERAVKMREYYTNRMKCIDDCLLLAADGNHILADYMGISVKQEKSYDILSALFPGQIGVSRDEFYDRIRRFFYILDKERENL